MTESATPRTTHDLEHAVVRFAGDSGDGMQLTGTEFTREAALHGNDLATFPEWPIGEFMPESEEGDYWKRRYPGR